MRRGGNPHAASMPHLRSGGLSSAASSADLHKVGGSRLEFQALHDRGTISTGARILVGRSGGVPKDLFATPSPAVPATRPKTLAASVPRGVSAAGFTGTVPLGKTKPAGATSQFTVQRDENRWTQVGRPEPALERPAGRREILALDAQYTGVMEHAQAFAERMEGGGATSGGVGMDPVVENDLFACQASAAEIVRQGCKPNETDGGRPTEDVLSEVTWRLATALFEQKWTDLVMADVGRQVSVSCLEHGNLIDRLRDGTAAVFGHFKQVVSVALSATADALRRNDDLRAQYQKQGEDMAALEATYEKRFEAKVAAVNATSEKAQAQARQDVTEANDQVERMSETLRTLNAAFRQLRSDDKSMRVADLRLACNQLEAKLTQRNGEVEALLPLKDQVEASAAALADSQRQLDSAKQLLGSLKLQLREKTVMLQEAMQREADRLAELEMLASQPKKPSEGADGAPSGTAEGTVLCARCNSDIAAVTAKTKQEQEDEAAIACRSYRLLLPNVVLVDDTPPYRTSDWVRWVMRSIIMAKMRADMFAERAGAPRPRFPEFVYAWFHSGTSVNLQSVIAGAPGASASMGSVPTGTPTVSTEAYQRTMASIQLADERRWALYYGMKAIAKSVKPGGGSFEAKLFYNFLDEKYGEDELTFFLYCLRTVEGVLSTPLDWGPTTSSSAVTTIPERLEAVKAPPRDIYGKVIADPVGPENDSGSGPLVEPILWIGLRKALAAAARVLARASDQDRQITLRRIKAKAVEVDGHRLVDQVIPPDPPARKTATATLRGLGGTGQMESHLARMKQAAAPKARPRVRRPAEEVRCVDLFVVLRMLLVEYREEQAHRRAAVTMMFDAAAESKMMVELKEAEETAAAEAALGLTDDSKLDDAPAVAKPRPVPRSKIAVDLRQFTVMVTTLHRDASIGSIAEMYRSAYDVEAGGVTMARFLEEAERAQLFSNALRLPPFAGAMRSTTLSRVDLRQLAGVVHRRFSLLTRDLSPWLDVLPDPWAQQLRFLRAAVAQELEQCGNGFSVDGRRPLVAYRRYLYLLLYVRMCRREEVGEAGGPLAIRHVEQELGSLEMVVRNDAPALLPGPEELRRLRLMLGHRGASRLLGGLPLDTEEEEQDDGEEEEGEEEGAGEGEGGEEEEDDDDDLLEEGVEDLIHMGLTQAPAGDPRVLVRTSQHALRFEAMRRNLCATRIQRAFRARSLPAEGVPFHMRTYMHRWYNPHTGALRKRPVPTLMDRAPQSTDDRPMTAAARGWLQEVAHKALPTAEAGGGAPPEAEVDEDDVGKVVEEVKAAEEAAGTKAVTLALGFSLGKDRTKPVAEALAIVLASLAQLYLAKLQCDRNDDATGIAHQAMCEFVYDYYMQLFGVREVAERELHQLFTSVREHAHRHPRVRLFALFCGIPMTHTESTKHGFFDLDAHLRTRAPAVSASVPEAPTEEGGAATTTVPATEAFTAAEASGVKAASAPSFGLASREREAATERELMTAAAVDFYLKLLLALSEDASRPVDDEEASAEAAASAPVIGTGTAKTSGLLFPTNLQPPETDVAKKKTRMSDVPKPYIRMAHARRVTNITLEALSDAASDRVSRRFSAFEESGLVDMDMVLRLCMEEWAAETYKRGQKLAALFHAGDVDTNGVLSLDEFMGVIRHVRPKDSDTDAVRMFREASVLTEFRIRQRTGGTNLAGADETEIDVVSFLEVARRFGLSTVRLEGGADVPSSRDPTNMAQLLTLTWGVYEDGITGDAAAEVPEPPADSPDTMAVEVHQCHQKLRTRLDRFQVLSKELEDMDADEETAEAAWLAFRLLLSDWGRFRQLVGAAVPSALQPPP